MCRVAHDAYAERRNSMPFFLASNDVVSHMSAMRSLLLAFLVLVFGCAERPPELAQPLIFQIPEFRFAYPSNWFVASQSEGEHATTVKVKSFGDAFVFVMYFKAGHERSFPEFTAEFSRGAESATGVVQSSTQQLGDVSTELGFSRRDELFTLNTLGLSRSMRRHYRMRTHKRGQLYFIAQSPEASWQIIEPGVDLMARSLQFSGDDAGR